MSHNGRRLRYAFVAAALAAAALVMPALARAEAAVQPRTLYIAPTEDGFHTFLAAAIIKKKVRVTLTKNQDAAAFVLRASPVEVQQQTTGSKVVRCLFAYCAGIEDRGLVSVQLEQADMIVWSYSVNKGRGQKNFQSMAEAVAKHLGKHLKKM